jgi:hypothetical protein
MTQNTDLHARLLQDARNCDPAAHHRSRLAPYRDVLLLWRAKHKSYEQIAATLTSHGIRVSPAGIGVFCRSQFTKHEIDRARGEVTVPNRPDPSDRISAPTPILVAPVSPSPVAGFTPTVPTPNRRGPKIARDNY